MKIKFNCLFILIIPIFISSAVLTLAHAQTNISDEKEIEKDIDYMLNGLNEFKVNMQPRIDQVVKYGDIATPLLIKRYKEIEDIKCWPIISCLCKISSDNSLEFIRKILKEHKNRRATSHAINDYPINKEDDIVEILINLIREKTYDYDASERFKKIIMRNPKTAGALVAALKDDDNLWEYYYHLGEILAWVSGYSNTWAVSVPPNENPAAFRNRFWREWWERNQGKEVFEWLLETINTNNSSRKAQALQMMAFLNDKRASIHFVDALDDSSESVRYWAVVGLKKLSNTCPESGYKWEDFKKEETKIIEILQKEYKNLR